MLVVTCNTLPWNNMQQLHSVNNSILYTTGWRKINEMI